jgi:hypothetical protein
MNKFEDPLAVNAGEIASGSTRGPVESEQHTDTAFERLLIKLDRPETSALMEEIESIPEGAKEKLYQALNRDDKTWELFGTIKPENMPAAIRCIAEWKNDIGKSIDPDADKNICQTLINQIYDL